MASNRTGPIVVTFLGTVSAVPSLTRSNSSLALRLDKDVWLFDCGEATLQQLQRSKVRIDSIRKIFITHMHSSAEPRQPLEIYGPHGLRAYIRSGLTYTYADIQNPFVVHELRCSSDPDFQSNLPRQPGERAGRDIAQGAEGVWRDILTDGRMSVSAAPILHSCPCIGYVVQEPELPPEIDPKRFMPLLKRTETSKKTIGRMMGLLRQGMSVDLSDGTKLHGPSPRPGRKIVILGDTHDPSAIAPLAHDADLLVHEATLAHLPGVDPSTKRSDEAVEERAKSRGHSTPQMAGAFAKRIDAKRLVLNHFSRRYSGGRDVRARKIMEAIGRLAEGEFGKPVECARDLDQVVVKLAN
ncbi:beta-lactamase-like protein [Schizophyllum commune]